MRRVSMLSDKREVEPLTVPTCCNPDAVSVYAKCSEYYRRVLRMLSGEHRPEWEVMETD